MDTIKENTLNKLADSLIKELNVKRNPFDTITIVFPNATTEAWFKAYFLKSSEGVLMNVSFVRMRGLMTKAYNTSKLVNKDIYKNLILKYLLNEDISFLPVEISSYIKKNNTNLYSLAATLSGLYVKYEEELTEISDWQKTLYDSLDYGEYKRILDYEEIAIKNQHIFVFGYLDLTPLNRLFLERLAKNNTVKVFELGVDKVDFKDSILGVAPSKYREVQFVHTEICKLLENNDVTYSDILVVAPDISSYKPLITKVFTQNEEEGFYNIPYNIADRVQGGTSFSEALELLFSIIEKKDFTREDFYNLITNSLIMKNRNLTFSFVDAIMTSLINMNIYRGNELAKVENEWVFYKKRLLLSLFVGNSTNIDNIVTLRKEDYLPYGSIDLTRDYIYLVIGLIEDLRRLIDLFGDKESFSKDDLENLKCELDVWFYNLDDTNTYYQNVIDTIDYWYSVDGISKTILFVSLVDKASSTFTLSNGVFTSGVTFQSLNTPVSSKYVFFMGMNSKDYPKRNVKSLLDLANDRIDEVETQKKLFCSLVNNASKCYFSYSYLDLKTEEEYFKSSLIPDGLNEVHLTIDEKRDISLLYTKDEINNKKYYNNLNSNEVTNTINHSLVTKEECEYVSKVKASDIKKFLKEALSFKLEYLFKKYSNYKYEDLNCSKEPLTTDLLNNYRMHKELIELLAYDVNKDISLNMEKYDILKLVCYYDKDNNLKNIEEECKKYIDNINDINKGMNTSVITLGDVLINDNNKHFIVNYKDSVLAVFYNNNIICFYEMNIKSYEKYSNILGLYVFALGYIASLNSIDKCRIILADVAEVNMTSNDAIEILRLIHEKMFDFNDIKIRPYDFTFEKKQDINNLIETVNGYRGLWQYSDETNLINPYHFNGYNFDDFDKKWQEESDLLDDMINIIWMK